jgi:hypothetical protein
MVVASSRDLESVPVNMRRAEPPGKERTKLLSHGAPERANAKSRQEA